MFSTIFLQLIVFFLPTQLGLHFWPEFSRAAGIKVDYLSPTLYLVDLLLIFYISLSFSSIIKWIRHHLSPVLIFLVFVFVNTFFSISPLNALFWWAHLILYTVFFLVLRLRKVRWTDIKTPLLASTLLIIFLEVIQLVNQSSVGGLFYWLGERAFSTSTPGLARISFFGHDFVRAPSTFSHPNSLAGYLMVVYYLFHVYRSSLWQRLVIFLGLLLTFSKAALLAFLLVISLHANPVFLIWFFTIFSFLQPFVSAIPTSIQFISDRVFLLTPTKDIILESSLMGVGLGGFIPSLALHLPGSHLLSEKLQPVHNLPLLLLSEIGLIGLGIIILLIRNKYKKNHYKKILALLAIVIITGAFDHYWWTLPQNKLILLLAGAVLL
ncbi:hypothetical protein A3K29_01105 [Candidatus Collierbacteria bacterium RIFOXYB2_FULL_46_14]|nr:MAG: hypothetical protein A3K29_01105 [Candidatus Collierbacteria bacterium RIFOXYB2_FULL_46_14]OGD75771.1 MAG: hypothetical protein A3K43_01105 [Candidatus Collierbacteria bacterium RIFOXYA2_FULL_46_20]OGD77107.1 MAG: hypothetical protein A3K39_01105 [Candidatus Collierbacteria bacterium RIFOXYC2_FULL_43_15]OGD80397.1 MAG: hypothetical protein A2320_01595 [Pseudomonadales bacterium GWC2_63_15]OGD81829.1 MAG: hypothetical protein A3K36_01105 [Candidatus Collierbacteria bacterium RIFOXYD2_FUL